MSAQSSLSATLSYLRHLRDQVADRETVRIGVTVTVSPSATRASASCTSAADVASRARPCRRRRPAGSLIDRLAHCRWTHFATEGTLMLSTAQMRYHPGGRTADDVGKVIDPFVTGNDR